MARKILVAKYYLHYDKSDGKIICVSNEAPKEGASFEVTFEIYKDFIERVKRTEDYTIGYITNDTNELELALLQKNEYSYNFKNNKFVWINSPPTVNTDLTVEWNKQKSSWIFSLSKNGKILSQHKKDNTAVFFVMLKNDFDFLIRTIMIDAKHLIEWDNYEVPFESNLEMNIGKISISSQILFDTYGLKING